MTILTTVLLVSALLALVSVFSSLIAFRYGAPLLLLFLLVGLGARALMFGDASPYDAQTAFIIGAIALAVVLFESGFTTSWSSYRLAAWPAITMATVGVLLTSGLVTLAGVYFLHMSWLEAGFLGAVLSSTDAAAVFFLLRVGGINIGEKVRSVLEIESGTNDPMAIMLTMMLAQIASVVTADQSATPDYLDILRHFGTEMAVGLLVGYAGGKIIVQMINRLTLDPNLYPLLSLFVALLIFAVAGKLHGSGFLAIYVAGLVSGNSRMRNSQAVRKFHEGISWMAQIAMFLVLGLMADPRLLMKSIVPALGIAFVLIFIARPVAAFLCLAPFKVSIAKTAFVGWVGLRGAVSILLALLPLMAHLPAAETIFSITFIVVMLSLAVQGWTIKPMAKGLGLIVPPQSGAVHRLELDLPMDAHYELIAYEVDPQSPVARTQGLPLWARPALVLRDGRPVPVEEMHVVRPHDHVYLFTEPKRLKDFDRLFGAHIEDSADEREFYGDIALEPHVTLGQLAALYGLQPQDNDDAITLADLFARECPGGFEIGARLCYGGFTFILRALDEKKILSVGLVLDNKR